MVESDSARVPSGLVLARMASTRASILVGRSLSNGIAPKGAGSRCLRLKVAYSDRVESLQSATARVVSRHCANHSAMVRVVSLTGAPASIRSWAFLAFARAALAVGA